MRYEFYDSITYRKKQSSKTKELRQSGHYRNLLGKVETRLCQRQGCKNSFQVKRFDPKKFCSSRCAAIYNNDLRGPLGLETKEKISQSLKGRPSRYRGKIIVPRLVKICLNCGKEFKTQRWENHKYCSVTCAIHDIGSRKTSPKAARGKSGVRPDINSADYFYSRWEANFARILNFTCLKWEFQPKTFALGTQKYTPDFYLPELNLYVEVKNFLSSYSLNRDRMFRKLYPKENLLLILKEDYLHLQKEFAPLIKNWEYS